MKLLPAYDLFKKKNTLNILFNFQVFNQISVFFLRAVFNTIRQNKLQKKEHNKPYCTMYLVFANKKTIPITIFYWDETLALNTFLTHCSIEVLKPSFEQYSPELINNLTFVFSNEL